MRLPDASRWAGSGWRAVEAQHVTATMALVNHRVDDQAVLEQMLDETAKPPQPDATRGLHFLLAAPFRYKSPTPAGSRFRAQFDPAVFFGGEDVPTACAESGYWRWRFWMDSEGLANVRKTIAMTLFEFHAKTQAMLDLTVKPLSARRSVWTDKRNYAPTQNLAREARARGGEIIRSESARNGPDGRCLNLLTPRVFKHVRRPYRDVTQTWQLHMNVPVGVIWQLTVLLRSSSLSDLSSPAGIIWALPPNPTDR